MEADVRHAEIIVKELVEGHHKAVVTPGVDYEGAEDEHPDLVGEYAHAYRRLVARTLHQPR